jgi:acetyltransferase EpsM
MDKKLVIIGNGGHSRVISDIVRDSGIYEILGYLDDNPERERIGPLTIASDLYNNRADLQFVIAIGNNAVRKRLVNDVLNLPKEAFAILVHSKAIVSGSAIIKEGSVVMPGAIINANAKIGGHCIINTAAIIEHDCKVKDFVHVSPAAALSGNVLVEEGVHLGSGSVVIPGKRIGQWSIIGAGSTVIRDLPNNCTAVGSPTRLIKGDNND